MKKIICYEWELFPNTKDNPFPLVTDWSENELIDVDTNNRRNGKINNNLNLIDSYLIIY